MQKQIPVSFSHVLDPKYSTKPIQEVVMVVLETSRSGKQVIRARGYWDGDLHTVVKNIPPTPEWDQKLMTNSEYSMSSCHYFWDWMRYGTVLAILKNNSVADCIDYDDICYFLETLDPPKFQVGKYVFTDYFGKLEEFAKSVKLKFHDNNFSNITMRLC